MFYLEETLPTPAENLALEEVLLDTADAATSHPEVLRIWQANRYFVVLGRSSKVDEEVDRQRATDEAIPILRRVSGGATVLAGPGCMFYSLLLSLEHRPQLRMLDEAHRFVMSRMVTALRPWVPQIEFDGTCDLVVEGKKVSGNSLRLVRNWMLYHGTLLLDLDLGHMDRLLKHPPREPAYRQGRQHSEFVTNLHLPYARLAEGLRVTWKADQPLHTMPQPQAIEKLVREKYSQPAWNFSR